MEKHKFIVGIDEVGRGPLAGPVAVGACVISVLDNQCLIKEGFFKDVKDSKKLSGEKREEWLDRMNKLKVRGFLDYYVAFVSNKIIDEKGLTHSIKSALKETLEKLKIKPADSMILLDGGLKAPEEFIFQQTIIKGDEKKPIISLASIAAKVARDRKMVAYSKKFPQYGFEIHKGYGTLLHRQNIKKQGLSELHRKSFCKNIGK